MPSENHIQELFNAQGEPLGALIPAAVWQQVRDQVLSMVGGPARPQQTAARNVPEPLSDWDELVQLWDFKYPVDTDVACTCGNATSNWRDDEPRKFLLTAANLGGLVTFRCLSCESKIMKRHFKDKISVEVRPYIPEKGARNLGRPEQS